MVNSKNLKKLVSIAIIISFVLPMEVYLYSREKDEFVEQFQEAKNQYNGSKFDDSRIMVEAVIGTINEKGFAEQKKDLLGQCYLLQGAIAEKKGEPVAEEHYRRAIEDYGIDSIDGVNLEELVIYKKVRLTFQVEKDFALSRIQCIAGQYDIARLNEILQTIKDNQLGLKAILGKTSLLLGAGNEKAGNLSVAEMNYRDAFKTYGTYVIDGVDLNDLPLYSKIKRVIGIEDQFENAKLEYHGGRYTSSKKSIEEIIALIPEQEIDPGLRKILGQCFLLLSAIYDKEGNTHLARENYRNAQNIYGVSEIQGFDLSGLSRYKVIEQTIIEHPAVDKKPLTQKPKKKFPWLIVGVGVAAVIVLAFLFKKKKEKEYTLTVTRGAGVDGEPVSGTYSYKKGTSVHYNYTQQPGYNNLIVLLDNSQVETTGTITMDGNHTLTATATQNAVAFVTSTDSISVGEGSSNNFTVKLSAQPTGNITSSISWSSGDPDISVTSGSSLLFNTSNWNIPQTVTLRAAEDVDTDNNDAIIRISAPGIPDKTIAATEIDNDPINPGITFVTDKDTLTISEGKTASFQVKLSGKPKKTITASVSRDKGDSDISVTSGSNLTFTTSTWGTYQIVTLQAAEDDDDTGSKATILISATTAQSGIQDKNIEVTENDNDKVKITVVAPKASESVKTGTPYTIRWQTTGTLNNVNIKLWWGTSGNESGSQYIVQNTTNTGTYDWTPLDIVNNSCWLTFEKTDETKKEVGKSGIFKIVN